jgi:UDP-N-acetylglucosamine enolpyruvyl transferase
MVIASAARPAGAMTSIVSARCGSDTVPHLRWLDHMDRGYDGMAEKLTAWGADIIRSMVE